VREIEAHGADRFLASLTARHRRLLFAPIRASKSYESLIDSIANVLFKVE
jgi:hypothetical protein